MTRSDMTPDRALMTGAMAALLTQHGIDAYPTVDADGDYTPELVLELDERDTFLNRSFKIGLRVMLGEPGEDVPAPTELLCPEHLVVLVAAGQTTHDGKFYERMACPSFGHDRVFVLREERDDA